MNSIVRSFLAICGILFSIVGLVLPPYMFYMLWDWVMGMVPPGDYSGLIKICMTLVMLWMGGGITIFLSILLCSVLVTLFVSLMGSK